MIYILHNTLLATPKLKFCSGAFVNFWGPPNPATTIFMCPISNCTLGNLFFWGVYQTQNLLLGILPILGAHWGIWIPGAQHQILLSGHLSFWGSSQTEILLWGFWLLWVAHWGLLGFRVPKSNLISGPFTHRWGLELKFDLRAFANLRNTNSNLISGVLPIRRCQKCVVMDGLCFEGE
jgi:hypothetical protein